MKQKVVSKGARMGVVTRIGIGQLLGPGQSGSIALPEEITLYCPQCGTFVADKGDCLVALEEVTEPAGDVFSASVKLMVDCRR